jgi:hypothetical protein
MSKRELTIWLIMAAVVLLLIAIFALPNIMAPPSSD